MKKLLLIALVATGLVASSVTVSQCTGCHGQDWSKSALNKSKVVSEMSREDIATALKGYKDGSYNSAGMGSLMKGQVMKYSDTELEEIASLITKK